jgi:hypothetical protein
MPDSDVDAAIAFITHVTRGHGFGSRSGDPAADAMVDAVSLASAPTRAYHEHLHRPKAQDHDHDEAELARWRP